MALTFLKFISFLFILSSAKVLRKPLGGDPVPPPYPVVNVHIPEPALGADDFKFAMIAQQHGQDSLLTLEKHMSSMEKQSLTTLASLSQEMKSVIDMIEIQIPA